jgi:peptidoglycan hydrolase-like protein with peptidoglycan-binding domain
VEGQIISGTTDSDGRIEISIPPNSIEGELKVTEGGEIRTYRLALGHVDPADSVSGAQVRLRNLGYDPGPVDNQMGPCTRTALRAFQKNQDLSVTGQRDATTCDRLKEAYGG